MANTSVNDNYKREFKKEIQWAGPPGHTTQYETARDVYLWTMLGQYPAELVTAHDFSWADCAGHTPILHILEL